MHGCVDAPALIVPDLNLAMIGAHSGAFVAFNYKTGKLYWKQILDSPVFGKSCLFKSSVFVGTRSGIVYRIRIDNGTIMFKFDTGSQIKHGIWVNDIPNHVMVNNYSKELLVFNEDLTIIESIQDFGILNSKPIHYKDSWIGVTLKGEVLEISKNSFLKNSCSKNSFKTVLFDLKSPVLSKACLHENHLYLGCTRGKFYKISILERKIMKIIDLEKPILSQPIICKDSRVMISAMNEFLVTDLDFNPSSWIRHRFDEKQKILSQIGVNQNAVVIGSTCSLFLFEFDDNGDSKKTVIFENTDKETMFSPIKCVQNGSDKSFYLVYGSRNDLCSVLRINY